MPIRRLQSRNRSKVFWLGAPALAQAKDQLSAHSFLSDELKGAPELPYDLVSSAAALVFTPNEVNAEDLVPVIRSSAARLLDHGCLVFILASSGDTETRIRSTLAKRNIPYVALTEPQRVFDGQQKAKPTVASDLPLPHVRIYPAEYTSGMVLAAEIAQYAPRYVPAADTSGVFDITGAVGTDLCKKERLLLRRSFHDCFTVHLSRIDEGKSGAKTFIARATPRPEVLELGLSPRIIPFFAKVGARAPIIKEWRNYEDFVRHQIPFHLAPRLDWGRCEIGARLGILVGDFVDHSESLSTCAVTGRGSGIIRTLFDRTMREWQDRSEPVRGSLYRALRDSMGAPRLISEERLNLAKEMGGVLSLEELQARIESRPLDEEWLRGPIHGDLHTDNVRVRGSDAILIDFFRTGLGPTLADAAALEASIVFRAAGLSVPFDHEAWKRTAGGLYVSDTFRKATLKSDPRDAFHWIVDCVRQIRTHALPQERTAGQYATVLAYRLLYMAGRSDKNSGGDEYRRAFALVTAGSLLNTAWN